MSNDSIANVESALKIGQQKDGQTSRFTKCNISEIIIFSRDLKPAERKSVEGYLSKKWGVGLDE